MSASSSEHGAPGAANPAPVFLNFAFFKVDPKWRWLNEIGKGEAARELASLVQAADTKMMAMRVRTYSTLGLREDADLMFWMISDSLEKTQAFTSKLYSTVFGKYLAPSYVYLAASRPSIYSGKLAQSYLTDAPPLKYVIVYPFVKTREWYLLPFEERKEMMEEHGMIGRRFPQVRLNTSYSFGLDDQDFMLAFETEDLSAWQDLIMQLRESKASRYVVRDTPMLLCVKKDIEEIVRSIG